MIEGAKVEDGFMVYREPLTLVGMAKEACENYWKGNCKEAGRHPNAVYGADAYCWPCKLRHVIGLEL